MRMKVLVRIFISIILIAVAWQSISAERIEIDDSTFFVGNSCTREGTLYYSGVCYNSDLTKITGIFDKDLNPLRVFFMLPDSTRFNYDSYTSGLAVSTFYLPGRRYEEYFENFLLRYYNFDRGLWFTENFAYNNDSVYPVDDVKDLENRIVVPMLKYLCMPGLMLIFVYMSLGLIPLTVLNDRIRRIIIWVTVVLLAAACIFAKENYINGIFFPVLVFLIIWCSAWLIKKRPYMVAVRAFACIVAIGLFVYDYLLIDESVQLNETAEVQFRWQRGSDPVKRAIIRNIARNLISVPGTDQYLSKYELRNYEFDILSGEWMGWVSMLYPNEVKDNLSYKDASIVLNKICEVSGNYNFVILDTDTWGKAYNESDYKLFRELKEQQKSGSGSPNHLGLYDLEGSVREWTTCPGLITDIETGRVMPDYTYAIIAGGSYMDNNFAMKNYHKSMNTLCGLRVAYGKTVKPDYMVVIEDMTEKDKPSGSITLLKRVDDTDLSSMSADEVIDYLVSKSGSERTYHIVRIDSSGNERNDVVKVAADNAPFSVLLWPRGVSYKE